MIIRNFWRSLKVIKIGFRATLNYGKFKLALYVAVGFAVVVFLSSLLILEFPRLREGMVAWWLARLASGYSGSSSSPGREHCVVFLEKAL